MADNRRVENAKLWVTNRFNEIFRSHYYWHASDEGIQRRIKALRECKGIGQSEVRDWAILTEIRGGITNPDDLIALAEELSGLTLDEIWGRSHHG